MLIKNVRWGVIKGQSMNPVLMEGFRVKIEFVPGININEGDIIVFGEGIVTCHRVVKKIKILGHTFFIQQGDHARWGCFVEASRIKGKVTEAYDRKGVLVDIDHREHHVKRLSFLMLYVYAFVYLLKQCMGVIMNVKGQRISR